MNILTGKKTEKRFYKKPDEEIMNILNQRRKVYEDHAKIFHPIWYLCFLRGCGQHYSEFHNGLWTYLKSKPYMSDIIRNAPRPKIDKVSKSIDHLIGLLSDGFPIARVKPALDDPSEEDRLVAKVADEWVRYKQERVMHEDEQNEETFLWILTTGNWFRQAYIAQTREEIPFVQMTDVSDPQIIPAKKCTACSELNDANAEQCISCGAGSDMLIPSVRTVENTRRDVMRDKSGMPVTQKKPGNDIAGREISPFQFFPNTRGKNFRTMPDWFVSNIVSSEWMESNFKASPQKMDIDERLYDFQRLINDMPPDIYGESLYFDLKDDDTTSDSGVAFEYYQRPIPGYDDEGSYIIYTEKEVLKKAPYPYLDGMDGIQHYGWRPTGRFWYAGLVETLFPVNDHINSVMTQAAYNRKLHANPRTWNPIDSGVSKSDFYNGKSLIDYDGEMKPHTDNPPDMGDMIKYTLEVLYTDYREMDGLQDILRGIPPKNARTASGYQMLLESASNPFKRKISRVQRLNREYWEFQLWQAQNLLDENQVLKITHGKFAGKLFTSKDIKGYLTIDVDSSAPFPRSRAAQQQRASEMMQYIGSSIFMRDPHALHEFMKLMDIQTSQFDVMFERHQEQAQKENIAMKSGQPVQINMFDNHNVHLYEHQVCYFSDVVQANPKAGQIIAQHMQMHQMEYFKKQMASQGQQQKPGQPGQQQKQEEQRQQQPQEQAAG